MRKAKFACLSLLILGFSAFKPSLPSGFSTDRSQTIPWLWPFLGYPMYAIPHYEGDRMSRNRVYGILADSSEVAVTHSTLGTDFWTFRRGLVFALLNGDRQEIEAFADLYEQRHGRRPVPFRLEDHPLILGYSGVTEARPEVRMIVPVEPQEGAL